MEADPVLGIARRCAHLHKTLWLVNGAIGLESISFMRKYCKHTQDEYSRKTHFMILNIKFVDFVIHIYIYIIRWLGFFRVKYKFAGGWFVISFCID